MVPKQLREIQQMSLKFRSREFTRNRKIEENMKKKNLNFVDRHALWPPFQIQQQFVRDPLSEKKNTVRCSSCSVFLQVEKDEGKEAGFIFFVMVCDCEVFFFNFYKNGKSL